MLIIRPVALSDLDDLIELAKMASFGLTTLPRDRELLSDRIALSEKNFEFEPQKPQGELYIFVMEDLDSAKVVGTSLIVSKVGGFDPFYAFRLETCLNESAHLKIRKELSYLRLLKEHNGPTEIGGLFLAPNYRKHGAGRLMSLFRFLFMADRRPQFESVVIAEMRGVADEAGRSPFWEAVGSHFFDMNYEKADYLSLTDKRFIGELMPRSPLYVCLLPREAQEVIGKVHENTKPALKMLRDEGFKFNHMVDIFDAGPMVACPLDDIRVVKDSVLAVVENLSSSTIQSSAYIIATVGKVFRSCVGTVCRTPSGGAIIEVGVAETMGINIGDFIRFSPLRPANSLGQKVQEPKQRFP
ncbi:MAG: arginine N-succinyltransferase [Desulfomonilaceae bacterium]